MRGEARCVIDCLGAYLAFSAWSEIGSRNIKWVCHLSINVGPLGPIVAEVIGCLPVLLQEMKVWLPTNLPWVASWPGYGRKWISWASCFWLWIRVLFLYIVWSLSLCSYSVSYLFLSSSVCMCIFFQPTFFSIVADGLLRESKSPLWPNKESHHSSILKKPFSPPRTSRVPHLAGSITIQLVTFTQFSFLVHHLLTLNFIMTEDSFLIFSFSLFPLSFLFYWHFQFHSFHVFCAPMMLKIIPSHRTSPSLHICKTEPCHLHLIIWKAPALLEPENYLDPNCKHCPPPILTHLP